MKAETLTKKNRSLFEQASTAEHNKLNQTWLKQFSRLINFFAGSNEPIIRQSFDRQGNSIWQIYDPTSNRTVWCNSETEVRIWCEQRFNS